MMTKNQLGNEQLHRRARSATISHSPAAIKSNLESYIYEVFPSVFSQQTRIHRIVDEVKKHHRYFTIFTAAPGEIGDRNRFLTGIQLLTIQSMLCFLLAFFYDLQGPADDGSCHSF